MHRQRGSGNSRRHLPPCSSLPCHRPIPVARKPCLMQSLAASRSAGPPGTQLATTSRESSRPSRWRRGRAHRPEAPAMIVKIAPNDKGNPPGKLADAELHFTEGVPRRSQADRVRGLGAAQRRRPQRHVPRAPVLGQRRAAELRAAPARRRRIAAQERLRELILQAYEAHEARSGDPGRRPRGPAAGRTRACVGLGGQASGELGAQEARPSRRRR